MMIPYDEFARLRLEGFLPSASIVQLKRWEFLDRIWVGEAMGFSEWLRPEDDPDCLRSLSIDFAVFPEHVAESVLRAIQLPVRAGMSLGELDALFGQRISVDRYVADRVTYDYLTPKSHRYRVSCTVRNPGGLSYLNVLAPPVADEP